MVAGLSDAELEAQGDYVDEGFDEEFEDKDLNETEPNHISSFGFEFGDLDPKELQQLLDGDARLPIILEDFDLGVDVLDPEPTHPRSPGPYHVPNSPYQQSVVSPMELQAIHMNQYNESLTTEDPPSVQSNRSERSEEPPYAMLVSEGGAMESDSIVTVDTQFHPVFGLVDLAETTRLLAADAFDLSTALSSDTSIDTDSMYMFGNGTGQLSLLPSNSNTLSSQVTSLEDQVTTLMNSAMFTQTHSNDNESQELRSLPPSPQPPPSPLTPSSMRSHDRYTPSSSVTFSPSPSPSFVEQEVVSSEDKKLIDMPYYQFKKILDNPSIPEKSKEDIRNIRRRGRNKMAAKACRQKKLTMIMGLEQEVEKLKKTKLQMTLRTKHLEKEIAELKRQCCHR